MFARSQVFTFCLAGALVIPAIQSATAVGALPSAVRRPLPVVEIHRGIYAAVKPSDEAQWQGTVTFDHSVTMQGPKQLRRTTRAQVDLWRQTCDVAGCIETDIAATGVGAPVQTWVGDVSEGSLALPAVNVTVIRYAVSNSQYRKLDEAALKLPLAVSFERTNDSLQQAIVSNTTTLSTTRVTKQVKADVRVMLGSLDMGTVAGSAAGTIITTTIRR